MRSAALKQHQGRTLAVSHVLVTCNWTSLVYEAPVISSLLFLFQVVAQYFRSSVVTWTCPRQIDVVFEGAGRFRS